MKKNTIITTILTLVLALFMMTMLAGCGGSKGASEANDPGNDETITDEQALEAIENYCYDKNPDLESIINETEYEVKWDVQSTDEQEIVILFRSYTGAEVRYYIDRATGDTYVTEFVSGITEEEERTDETFNVKDYFIKD